MLLLKNLTISAFRALKDHSYSVSLTTQELKRDDVGDISDLKKGEVHVLMLSNEEELENLEKVLKYLEQNPDSEILH